MWFQKKKDELYPIGKEIPLKESDAYRFLDSITVHALKTGKSRMTFLACVFVVAFSIVILRLFQQTILLQDIHHAQRSSILSTIPSKRANILDRNGRILAISLPVFDLYVDARYMPNPEKLAKSLMTVFPDMDEKKLLKILKSKHSFTYLRRKLTPKEKFQVNKLGYPQLNFTETERRIYPQSNLFSHLLGFTNIDNKGIAGIEKQYNENLMHGEKDLELSLDNRIQELVHNILVNSIEKFQAAGGVAIVMESETAEILALTSVPDFDLNQTPIDPNKIPFNKASVGMYELGSVMKPFTVAFALENKLITPFDTVEAFNPYKLAKRRTITDFKAENRILSVPEVLVYSSNIGTAKIAQLLGPQEQKKFLNKFHFLTPLEIDFPEKGRPIVQKKWDDVETATIGYGYGIAVSPLHLIGAFNALVNGGNYKTPTFLKQKEIEPIVEQVISAKTSLEIKNMLRAVIEIGSGKKANIKGYNVIGKTGTAQKQDPKTGRYIEGKVRTSFIAAFPMDKPKYIVYVMIDDPARLKENYYFNTAGWNACPTGGLIIKEIAPLLGVTPQPEFVKPDYLLGAYEYIEQEKAKRKR